MNATELRRVVERLVAPSADERLREQPGASAQRRDKPASLRLQADRTDVTDLLRDGSQPPMVISTASAAPSRWRSPASR